MSFHTWFLIVGALLLTVALASAHIRRIPLTTSIVYLAIGFLLGPSMLGMVGVDMVGRALFWERSTEIVILLSLFTGGLKLAVPLAHGHWRPALLLATVSVAATVGLIAVIGVWLGLPLGVAVLLGAVLAPTDPVLASDVQVASHEDTDYLRFSLTGEAGLNDGTAFPFVLLGLYLINGKEVSEFAWHWFTVDVVWAVLAGVATGALLGILVGRVATYVHSREKNLGFEEFLAIGLIALSYGVADVIGAYGFLAVFAAALAFRRVERRDPKEKSSTRLAIDISGFNAQMDQLAEVFILILVGSALSLHPPTMKGAMLAALVLFVVRPLAVALGIGLVKVPRAQRALISWFGIRGIGSLYYLAYAFGHGFQGAYTSQVSSLCLTVILASILFHGVSVTPLMNTYAIAKRKKTIH